MLTYVYIAMYPWRVVMNSSLGDKIRKFREKLGLSQDEFAQQIGVSKMTVVRWETNSTKPSSLAAARLEEMGIPKLGRQDTKIISKPRIDIDKNKINLRKAIKEKLRIEGNDYHFVPSPYVINGPEDQIGFWEKLYELQEKDNGNIPFDEYIDRLSIVMEVEGVGSTAQYRLEKPKSNRRSWNSNYGAHGWHRYVGRFPPHLVRAILNFFGATNGDVVCDPFVGSGTTIVEARLLGIQSIGIEIGPLSALISRTKSKFPMNAKFVDTLIDNLADFYQEKWEEFLGNRNLEEILHSEILDRSGNKITPFPNYERWLTTEALLGTSIVVEFANDLKGYKKEMVCCALSAKMRSIGNVDVDVVRAEYRKEPRKDVNVLTLVTRALRKMQKDINLCIESHSKLITTSKKVKVIEGSLLDAKIANNSIDYIITSPPYGVETLSYLRTHLLSYHCLKPILKRNPYEYDEKIIGSEYLGGNGNKKLHWETSNYSQVFRNFFKQEFAENETKKLLTRKNMMMGFFDDMVGVAKQFSLWLKPGGKVAFVIGNKKLGKKIIPTDAIIIEIFESMGMNLDQVIKHKLKTNNSNSEVPWQSRIIQEEFILFFSKCSE